MSRQIDAPPPRVNHNLQPLWPSGERAGSASATCSQETGIFPLPGGSIAWSNDEIIGKLNRILERVNRDPRLLKEIAELKGTTLILSATDTGRQIMITFDSQGARARLCASDTFDVKIQATEEVHWALLSGEMDADGAFFAGKIRISGSISTAFRVKNRLLSLMQWHLARGLRDTDRATENPQQKGDGHESTGKK